jgi:hypothetical protein
MKQNRNMLGIVFYEQTIAVSEVEYADQTVNVRRNAEFRLPEGVTLKNVASARAQFGDFLKEQGFKNRKAAVGISSKHILSTPLKVPPIQDVQTRHETIKIHLERKLEMEMSDIMFDYWKSKNNDNQTILALTALKTTVSSIKSLLSGLKITPLCLTNTSFGLDFVTSPGVNCNMVEYPQSVEVFVFENGNLKSVLTVGKADTGRFDAELADKIVREVSRILWSVSVKSEDEMKYYWWTNNPNAAGTAGGLQTIFGNLKRMDINTGAAAGNLSDFAGRLAGKILASELASVNYLNGHYQEKRTTMTRQRLSKIAVFAGIVLLLIGFYGYGWYSDRSMIAQYQDQITSMKENVEAAQLMIEQVGFARQWFQEEPVHLDRLRELTLAFPQNSNIWVTSLAVDESLNHIITGRAVSEEAILDIVDTLKSNPLFGDIKLLYIRKMGQETDIMTFAINFHSRGEQ